MPGITSLLDMGKWALFGNQAAIETTGSNIANVNTPGYSRRAVRFEERASLDFRPGQLGTGVKAAEVIRYFDEFVEAQYIDKDTLKSRYEQLWQNLKSVDNLFNESNSEGINAALGQFFTDWQGVAQRPDDVSAREALMARTENMLTLLRNSENDLLDLQRQAEESVVQGVKDVNDILKKIAEINRQIQLVDEPGVNNANKLYDDRALLVRQLAEKMDIQVIEGGDIPLPSPVADTGGKYTIITKAGHTLLQGVEVFELKYEDAKASNQLSLGSQFDGQIHFEGRSDFEYTFEAVSGGFVASNASPNTPAMLRVSLDGGRTWLKDENGQELHFAARPDSQRITVGDLNIWFDGAAQMQVGDRFQVVPKNALYWYKNTSSAVNINPQQLANGSDDETRVTGGTLGADLTFIGSYVGRYRDSLNSMTESLIWNVNRLHSQGAGLVKITETVGSYSVRSVSIPLGSDSSGLTFNQELQAGSTMVYIYNQAGGQLASNGAFGPLDFSSVVPPGVANFDPTRHTLSNVAAAFNNQFGSFMTAQIVNFKLKLTAKPGYQMGFGDDATGLLAALGINTFFTGDDASTIAMNSEVRQDPRRLAAGHINGAFESNPGDNVTALRLAELRTKNVRIASAFSVSTSQTLVEFHATLVSVVGGDTANAEFAYQYNKALAQDLDDRQAAVAGVNLDDEMANLVKFQHSYRAAAKLITTAEEMLQTVLGLKQ